MAVVTYDGTAQDTRTIPQILARGEDGKPIRGAVIKPAKLMREPMKEYNLRGLILPEGKPVKIEEPDLIQKASTLGCFEIVVAEDEAACQDQDWLKWAKTKRRIKTVKDESKLPRAGKANEAAVLKPEVHDDGLDDMKYQELKRLAAEREISVPPGTKKVEIVKMIRELDGENPANQESEDAGPSMEMMGPGADLSHMQDLG